MKINILILFVTTLFLNGCCSFTYSCDCDLPNLVQLDEEPKNWLIPYEDDGFQVFTDENGNIDSLGIVTSQFTDHIGGDECDSNSESERIDLKSTTTDQKITIKANTIHLISVNTQESLDDFIHSEFNTQTEKVRSLGDNLTTNSGVFDANYLWNNQTTSALIITCDNIPECNTYQMQQYVISKDIGLLEFTDNNGMVWTRSN